MLMKKLLWTACAAIALTASAGINAEEYVVGTGATYRPFEYETPQKELVGFDVDLMRAIAKAEGFDVKFINTPWEGIFATVDKGDRDIIMSGITITDKRKQVVDFSKPYFLAHQLILTDKSVKINKLSDLSKGSVAVVSGSAGDVAASKAFGKASTRIRRFDNTPLALEELNQGGVVGNHGGVDHLEAPSSQNGAQVGAAGILPLAPVALVADGDDGCGIAHVVSSRVKSPWTPPVFFTRRMSVMTMSFWTALHIS